jgi:hypothetical protein
MKCAYLWLCWPSLPEDKRSEGVNEGGKEPLALQLPSCAGGREEAEAV